MQIQTQYVLIRKVSMKIKDYTCKCGHSDFFHEVQDNNRVGIYCSYCGKWFKWANKDEKNLLMRGKNDKSRK